MQAIILCAGYATRLYPLTRDKPKPLLPVADKPILDYILEKIEEVPEIESVIIVTNNKFYQHFVEYQKASPKNLTIVNDNTESEQDRLGAIGDAHFALQEGDVNDDVLVIAGDNLFDFSLKALVAMGKEKKSSVIALRDIGNPMKAAKKFGVVLLDKHNQIQEFEEKPEQPKSSLVSTCCYYLTAEDIALLKKFYQEGKIKDNPGDFITLLSTTKPVYGFSFTEDWFDIGSHEQYKEADRVWRKKTVNSKGHLHK